MPVVLLQKDMRVFNMDVQFYTTAKSITVQRGCTSFMFTNVGDVVASVNGMVIFPSLTPLTSLGDSRTVSAHLLDTYSGNIVLQFATPTTGVNPRVEIVQIFYVTSD